MNNKAVVYNGVQYESVKNMVEAIMNQYDKSVVESDPENISVLYTPQSDPYVHLIKKVMDNRVYINSKFGAECLFGSGCVFVNCDIHKDCACADGCVFVHCRLDREIRNTCNHSHTAVHCTYYFSNN